MLNDEQYSIDLGYDLTNIRNREGCYDADGGLTIETTQLLDWARLCGLPEIRADGNFEWRFRLHFLRATGFLRLPPVKLLEEILDRHIGLKTSIKLEGRCAFMHKVSFWLERVVLNEIQL